MGNPYQAVVHSQRGSPSVIDFATFDVALTFARARLGDPSTTRVEIKSGSELVYAGDQAGETFAEGVVADTTT